jgi:hypothetical protein
MDSATLGREERVASPGSRFALARVSAEDIAWLGPVPLTLLLLAIIFWLAPPLSDLYPAPDQQVFPEWRFIMRPEPLEATRFLVAVAGPALLAAVIVAVGTARPTRRSLDPAVIAVQLVGIGFLAWSITGQEHVFPLTRPDYFDRLLLSVPNLIAGVVIGASLTALLISRVELRAPRLRAIADWLGGRWWIALGVAVAFTAVWLLPALVTDATVGRAGAISAGHIPVQAGDYFAVVNGRTPLVDYIPIYAHLLPLALAPLLAAFDLSLTAFSITMCALSGIALLAVYATFSEVTRRPWAALALYLPFVAIALFPWDRVGAQWDYNGNYYGFFPGRYLGPFIVAWLCALHVRGRRIPAWAVFFAAGLAVANNAEFGVPCLAAAIIALGFGAERSIPIRKRALGIAGHAAAGVGGALALVCVVTLARSGELPNPGFATYWSSTFARDGYGLVPIPTLGLHWALYFTYAAAVLVAAVRYVRVEPDRTLTAMLAFAGIFGLLTGFYFAGRSVPWQLMLLFPVWGFALSLLTWAVVLSLRAARGDPLRVRRLIIPALATLAGFGVMVAAIDRFPAPWRQIDRLSAGGEAVNDQPAVQRFVDAHTTPGERVLIIGSNLDHRIAERAGVVNTSPYFGYLSLVSERDLDRAIDFLEDEGGRKVFESPYPLRAITTSRFPELARILRQRGFRPLRGDPSTGFVEWELQLRADEPPRS